MRSIRHFNMICACSFLFGNSYVPQPAFSGSVLQWQLILLELACAAAPLVSRTVVKSFGYRSYELGLRA